MTLGLNGEPVAIALTPAHVAGRPGAETRPRSLLSSEPEPVGGRPVPDGPPDLRVERLRFSYAQGDFVLSVGRC